MMDLHLSQQRCFGRYGYLAASGPPSSSAVPRLHVSFDAAPSISRRSRAFVPSNTVSARSCAPARYALASSLRAGHHTAGGGDDDGDECVPSQPSLRQRPIHRIDSPRGLQRPRCAGRRRLQPAVAAAVAPSASTGARQRGGMGDGSGSSTATGSTCAEATEAEGPGGHRIRRPCSAVAASPRSSDARGMAPACTLPVHHHGSPPPPPPPPPWISCQR